MGWPRAVQSEQRYGWHAASLPNHGSCIIRGQPGLSTLEACCFKMTPAEGSSVGGMPSRHPAVGPSLEGAFGGMLPQDDPHWAFVSQRHAALLPSRGSVTRGCVTA